MSDGGNPLGMVPPSLWHTIRRIYPPSDPEDLNRLARSDAHSALSAYPGRWNDPTEPGAVTIAQGWRPADILMYRGALVTTPPSQERDPRTYEPHSAVYHATPYLLTGAVAWGLAHTDIPAEGDGFDQLRLPDTAVSVWWPPMTLPVSRLDPPEMAAWAAENLDIEGVWVRIHDDGFPPRLFTSLAVIPIPGATVRRRDLLGVTLLAHDDGTPRDEVLWMVGQDLTEQGGWSPRIVVGRRSLSDWWQLLEAVTAIVAWGDWVADAPIVTRNRAKLRRLHMAGVHPERLSPIRVLDARHRSTAGAVRDATPSELRGPVTTHLRRGHWRQQAVGPRDEGRREPRWIAPTIVNPGGQPDDRPVAYRLLPPEKRMAAPRWVARRAKAPAVNPANRGGGGFLSGGRG